MDALDTSVADLAAALESADEAFSEWEKAREFEARTRQKFVVAFGAFRGAAADVCDDIGDDVGVEDDGS